MIAVGNIYLQKGIIMTEVIREKLFELCKNAVESKLVSSCGEVPLSETPVPAKRWHIQSKGRYYYFTMEELYDFLTKLLESQDKNNENVDDYVTQLLQSGGFSFENNEKG
ncbi:MAG: hypothetical protein RLZZ507_3531 [Cyanobacteriota bacterium]